MNCNEFSCGICYETLNRKLINKDQCPNVLCSKEHPICKDCNSKIHSTQCPFCRSKTTQFDMTADQEVLDEIRTSINMGYGYSQRLNQVYGIEIPEHFQELNTLAYDSMDEFGLSLQRFHALVVERGRRQQQRRIAAAAAAAAEFQEHPS